MHARPPGVPVFVVVGLVVWIGVTIVSVVSVVQSPAENMGLALGIALIWVVLLVFAAVERWTGGRNRPLRR